MLLTRRSALVVLAALILVTPSAAVAQAPTDTYYEFLLASRLEADGDIKGARAALERGVLRLRPRRGLRRAGLRRARAPARRFDRDWMYES